MVKKEYRLNPQTLTYEVVTAPFRLRFYRFLRKILIGFILASLVNLVISYFFYTPKMYRMSETHRELLLKYNLLEDKINSSKEKLMSVKHRDNHVYRAIFSADTLSLPAVYMPYPDSKYSSVQLLGRYRPAITNVWKSLDEITRILYLESLSLDELESLTKNKGKMSSSIPAIWPINRKFLHANHIGAFGYRTDPFTFRQNFHKGVDFGADTGTPVYTTGDGTVVRDRNSGSGYGNQILIDHGYGYVTRYAHLSKIDVKIGQKVKRGEHIGAVGNTGRSKGAHLHYEVLYRGFPVNPVNYFRSDMSEQEYIKIIENAKDTIFEYDD